MWPLSPVTQLLVTLCRSCRVVRHVVGNAHQEGYRLCLSLGSFHSTDWYYEVQLSGRGSHSTDWYYEVQLSGRGFQVIPLKFSKSCVPSEWWLQQQRLVFNVWEATNPRECSLSLFQSPLGCYRQVHLRVMYIL